MNIMSLIRQSLLILLLLWGGVGLAHAQTADQAEEGSQATEEVKIDPVVASLDALKNLLSAETDKIAEINAAKELLKAATEEATTAELTQQIEELNAQREGISRQIHALSTGVSDPEFDLTARENFNLQTELQQLVQPFVLMLKSATQEAREIERLRQTLFSAQRHQIVADKAIESLNPLVKVSTDPLVKTRLFALAETWQERKLAAQDLVTTVERQLQARLDALESPGESAGKAFTSFFSERGRNVLYGIAAFAAVFLVFRMAGRFVFSMVSARGFRGFGFRLARLIFHGVTFVAAFAAMLAVFNMFNDWLLTGLTIVLMLAIGWFALKTIPRAIEQITLLLNLGAVQEGERVMFNGIPWKVKVLDFYTDLENPVLKGGTFTLPVRELSGLHSRPMDVDEVWFPCNEGDWVILENAVWGKVVFQSPELVQLEEEGGATITYLVGNFLALNPKNLSNDYRVEIVFGIDYQHQDIATSTVIEQLRTDVAKGLELLVDPDEIINLEVEFREAGASSLDYEIEADIRGSSAHLHDEIKHALARLAVESCTRHGWNIPFPQLVVHRESK